VGQVRIRERHRRANASSVMRRSATLEQIVTATTWQAHSVRGFIAGPLKRGDHR
jgi:hypothetical protein